MCRLCSCLRLEVHERLDAGQRALHVLVGHAREDPRDLRKQSLPLLGSQVVAPANSNLGTISQGSIGPVAA